VSRYRAHLSDQVRCVNGMTRINGVADAMEVDLIFLSRDLSPPRDDVWRSVSEQSGVQVRIHRVTGPRRDDDSNRWATIARARNKGKRLGSAIWVMFVDDDVVLRPWCVAQLVDGLSRRPAFAALAADYNNEMSSGWEHWDYPRHVGMGATLFHREHLDRLTFRWESDKCECQCCCDDLRGAGLAIGYLREAEARHNPMPPNRVIDKVVDRGRAVAPPSARPSMPNFTGRILAAFDRNHFRRFRYRFLKSLRGSGNHEHVTAVTYGLYPSEQDLLAQSPGVEVIAANPDGHPAVRRLRDFQGVLNRWHEQTPVAYWDAGDVVFQGRLRRLWDLVGTYPDQLLAVTEPTRFADNGTIQSWVTTIRDPDARQKAMDLFFKNPVINSGFVASTASVMLRYFREAVHLRHSSSLLGSIDWGDQTVLNLYCHSQPHKWREIASGWNFCLCDRKPDEYRVHPDGRTDRLDGSPLYVVHGTAGTLKPWDLAL
jgi:hypothetical protein